MRRRTLSIGSAIIASIVLLLCLAHYFAVTRPWLAYNPEVARPLRLDRPDSFGHWIMCVLLAGSSGASLLIYQLRRYRNDDYGGQYRLWRLVLVLLMIASIHSLVGLIDWGGAVLDAALGKRVALSGNDWLRLLISIGSAILGLRLIAEVRRSRWALAWILIASVFLAIPQAVNWNVMKVETIGRWTLVTSAPLLACAALFLALAGYLRFLYREVKRIEDDSLAERFQDFKARVFQRQQNEEKADDGEVEQAGRRWWWFGSRRGPAEPDYQNEKNTREYQDKAHEEDEFEHGEAAEEQHDQEADVSPKRKRRWFGLRAARPEPSQDEPAETPEEEAPAEANPTKRRGWSPRRNPANAAEASKDEQQEPADEPEASEKPKRRFGLSWRRKEPAQAEAGQRSESQHGADESSGYQSDEDFIDPDEIDWNSMSKAERRRLRKKLKRQQRAA